MHNPPALKQPFFNGEFIENTCVFTQELDDFVQFFAKLIS